MKRLKIKVVEIICLKYINKYKYLKGSKSLKAFEKIKNKKKIILTLTPTHGNLGDHAIAYASEKFIKEKFEGYEFIELDLNEIYEKGKALKNVLGKDDIIMILGGGNMGDLYNHEEWTRRFIIETFKNTKIISLPQTICFSDSRRGRRELNKTKKIYNKHKNLKIIAREETSLEIMKNIFGKDRVGFYPDMVLSLSMKEKNNRDGVLLCLRSDKEGIFSEKFKEELIDELTKKYNKVINSDTVIKKNVYKETRERELKQIWKQIKSAEVVITDRLHGMIFCAITNTPCVVLKTYNHKVEKSFYWVSLSENIIMVENEVLENYINSIENVKDKNMHLNFNKYYRELHDYIIN